MISFHTPTVLSCAVLLYLAFVRTLRYRRRDAVERKFASRERYRDMTLEDAFTIQAALAEVEFPTVFSGSVFFALFKTYGIPSISRLLTATGQLSSPQTASKRAADTGVILTEVVLHHPTSQRAIDGIARMNYLHDRYRKAGKISDDDMLYTLSLFVLEPIRWTKRFDWREVSEVERCAMGTYWRWMGEAMEIPYTSLKNHKTGWTDGLHFLDDLEQWSMAYEETRMLPAKTNEVVAKHTIDIALFNIPRVFHETAFEVVSVLLGSRLRKAMLFPEPSKVVVALFTGIVRIRKFVIRHCFPPRPYHLRKQWWSAQPDENGRFHFGQYIAHPWYIKPTFWKRWGLNASLLRIVGGAIPGDAGSKYCPQGYKIPELGPEELNGRGEAEMTATRTRLRSTNRVGCPFGEW